MSTTTPNVTEGEVSLSDVVAEQKEGNQQPRPRPGMGTPPADTDQAPAEPQTSPAAPSEQPPQKQDSDLEILAPAVSAKEWKFGPEGNEQTYIQRELSVISKAQWFGLIGEIVDKSLGGENSFSLNSLLSPPENVRPDQLRMQDFREADTFVHAIGKLMMFSPEFLEKSVCIWLSVPDYEWDFVRAVIRQSPAIGGLSDDQAEEMLSVFIDQNLPAITTFFRDRFGRIRDRVRARNLENQSVSSKR